jgi:glutathione synthase/RimK-type ligase-like ATP-grasp enzyme
VPTPLVHVLHENPDWIAPFAEAFEAEGVPWTEHLLVGGALDLDEAPPPGVWWSRMSASSHTRGHSVSKDHTRAVLSWLEAAGRRVVNGRAVLELEMSKVAQLTALRAAGIEVPRTIAVIGDADLAAQARRLPTPFITKDNQGGKGLGVRRFDTYEAFDAHLASGDREPPVDGITLLQEYVQPAEPFITRVEIVGGAFVYAITADTRQGFELCPADACAVDDAMCPTGDSLFSLRKDVDEALVGRYLGFCRAQGIEVAGIEFIEAADGRVVTYDVNTNTNYNPDVEAIAERSGPTEIARFLGRLLEVEGTRR